MTEGTVCRPRSLTLSQQSQCKYIQLKSYLFAPSSICVYCNGTNHSLPAPIVPICVQSHTCTQLALFIQISILLQLWQHPSFYDFLPAPNLSVFSQKEVWVCGCVCLKQRGASGLCLLDIGGPCAPTMLWDKDCCLCSHKSSLSPSLPCCVSSPLSSSFSHTLHCRIVNGVRVCGGVQADGFPLYLWPLAAIWVAHKGMPHSLLLNLCCNLIEVKCSLKSNHWCLEYCLSRDTTWYEIPTISKP